MNYHSFVDHITAERCSWKSTFDAKGKNRYSHYHNMESGKSAYLKEDNGETISWEAALLFCRDIGIDPPAELIDKVDSFNELQIPE